MIIGVKICYKVINLIEIMLDCDITILLILHKNTFDS